MTQDFYIRGNSYYTIVSGPSWDQAEANANSLGGNLVTINNKEENDFLVSSFDGNQNLNPKNYYGGVNVWNSYIAWTGLNYDFSQNKWVNSNGENQTYFNWRDPNKVSYLPFVLDPDAGRTASSLYLSTSYSPIVAGEWEKTNNKSIFKRDGIAEIPLSYFSVSDLTITEGDSGNITISRTGGSNTVQNLTLASSNGTALAGTDYTAINQTITFAKGEVSKTVSIASIEDTVTESDETFTLTLTASSSDTVPAQITDGSATVTITDDDPTSIIDDRGHTRLRVSRTAQHGPHERDQRLCLLGHMQLRPAGPSV